jgi:eukaryotic-like serine/threonine-protein kinase
MSPRIGLPGRRGAAARYRVLRQIFADDLGAVWLAEDLALAHSVTIRSVAGAAAGDPRFLARFRRDVRRVKRLTHGSLATCFIVHVEQRGRWPAFAVMEPLVQTLRQRIRRAGPFPVREATSIVSDLADAVQTAHEAGIVHGRLDADGVMITPDGAAKVFDFGLASADGVRDPSAVAVSDGEISIELSTWEGAPTAAGVADDVRGLAAILLEMSTGEVLEGPARPATIRAALAGVPDAAAEACVLALSSDPRSRPSAAELALALSQEGTSPLSDDDVRAIREAFGAVLRERRSRAALTQAKLAGRSGLNASFVSQLERAVRAPSLLAVCALADALGTTPSEILDAVERRLGSAWASADLDRRRA